MNAISFSVNIIVTVITTKAIKRFKKYSVAWHIGNAGEMAEYGDPSARGQVTKSCFRMPDILPVKFCSSNGRAYSPLKTQVVTEEMLFEDLCVCLLLSRLHSVLNAGLQLKTLRL